MAAVVDSMLSNFDALLAKYQTSSAGAGPVQPVDKPVWPEEQRAKPAPKAPSESCSLAEH